MLWIDLIADASATDMAPHAMLAVIGTVMEHHLSARSATVERANDALACLPAASCVNGIQLAGLPAGEAVMTCQVHTRRRFVSAVVIGILAAGSLAAFGTPSAHAAEASTSENAVIVWDRNAQSAIWDVAGQQPQVQARSFAMVHGAIYDAVNAIAGTP
ncbi:hypothetical protein ABZV78_00910 [Micromonospora sp. NPDC004540]|uniref:hypothetical protein n=1 Tax=Micromonospora sp. NPDC004540 TaxID=3154457 RepID=UPI0033B8CD5F